jgi:lysophospholipase L1-like esterase
MKYKRVKSAVMLAGASFFLCVVFLVALNAISSVAIVGVSEWRRASNIQKLGDQLAALPNYLGREQEVRQIVADSVDLGAKYAMFGGYRSVSYDAQTLHVDKDGRRFDPAAPKYVGPPIAFYGGSTMWGAGEVDSRTIPAIFSRNNKTDVLNEGEGGYTSRNALGWLIANLATPYRVEMIVFYDGVNDIRNCDLVGGLGNHAGDVDADPAMARLFSYAKMAPGVSSAGLARRDYALAIGGNAYPTILLTSKLAMNFGGLVNRTGAGARLEDRQVNFRCAQNRATADAAAERMVRNWQMANALAQSRGIPFLAILQPQAYETRSRTDKIVLDPGIAKEYLAFYAAVRRRMALLNVDWFVDLSGALDSHPNEYFFIDFCHLSARGNEIMAQAIASAIAQRKISSP